MGSWGDVIPDSVWTSVTTWKNYIYAYKCGKFDFLSNKMA